MNLLNRRLRSFAIAACLASASAWAGPSAAPSGRAPAQASASQMDAQTILQKFDDARRGTKQWVATSIVQSVEKGKSPVLSEITTYNADQGDRVVLLFVAPKTVAGRGDLMIDRNIFYYDPAVGRWDRRTVRDNLVGGMNRSDFTNPRYSELYVPTSEGREQVNGVNAYKLLLKAKPGAEVAYAMLRIWIDPSTFHVIKDESYTQAGKLLRTGAYLNWVVQKAKDGVIAFPRQMKFLDIETGGTTQMEMKKVDLKPFDQNVFTKIWLEQRSR